MGTEIKRIRTNISPAEPHALETLAQSGALTTSQKVDVESVLREEKAAVRRQAFRQDLGLRTKPIPLVEVEQTMRLDPTLLRKRRDFARQVAPRGATKPLPSVLQFRRGGDTYRVIEVRQGGVPYAKVADYYERQDPLMSELPLAGAYTNLPHDADAHTIRSMYHAVILEDTSVQHEAMEEEVIFDAKQPTHNLIMLSEPQAERFVQDWMLRGTFPPNALLLLQAARLAFRPTDDVETQKYRLKFPEHWSESLRACFYGVVQTTARTDFEESFRALIKTATISILFRVEATDRCLPWSVIGAEHNDNRFRTMFRSLVNVVGAQFGEDVVFPVASYEVQGHSLNVNGKRSSLEFASLFEATWNGKPALIHLPRLHVHESKDIFHAYQDLLVAWLLHIELACYQRLIQRHTSLFQYSFSMLPLFVLMPYALFRASDDGRFAPVFVTEPFDVTIEEWLRQGPTEAALAKMLVVLAYQLLVAQSLMKLSLNHLTIDSVAIKRLPKKQTWSFYLKQQPTLFRYDCEAHHWLYFLNLHYAVVQVRPQQFLTTPQKACEAADALQLFNPSHDLRMFLGTLHDFLTHEVDGAYRARIPLVYKHLDELLKRNDLLGDVTRPEARHRYQRQLRSVVSPDFVPRAFLHQFQSTWKQVVAGG